MQSPRALWWPVVPVLVPEACPGHTGVFGREGILPSEHPWMKVLHTCPPLLLIICRCWQEILSWKQAARHWQVMLKQAGLH